MKTTIYTILISIIPLYLNQPIYSQDCYWSSQVGGIEDEYSLSVAVDQNKNSYMGGYYRSDPCIFSTGPLLCNGINDLFLVKYDPSGNEIWALRFGGPNETVDEWVGSIIVDTIYSRILITGSFYDTLTLLGTGLSGIGPTVFIIVMDMEKHVIWARAAGGNGDDIGHGITYDVDGNIYVSGANSMDATFEQITIPKGGFLAKYDKNGHLLWAKNKFRFASSYTYSEALPRNLLFSNQHLLVSGDIIRSTIIVDTIILTLPMGYNAAFVSSFSPQGDIEWLRAIGSPDGSGGTKISCDYFGNIYLAGTMWGSLGIFGDDTLYSAFGDCFLVRFSAEGSYQWAKGIQPSGFAKGYGVSTDSESNVYFTGLFMGYAHFGPYNLFSDATNINEMDIFLAKYNGYGECIGARQYSRGKYSTVSTKNNENVFLGGSFVNSLDISPQPLVSKGKSDAFIANCSPITGIIQPKPELSNTLLIYANPNTGQCRVTIPEEFNHEKTLILDIYDQAGRLIQKAQLNITGDSIELDISAQAKGMYNAILSNGKKYYSGKIIFE